ncbi:xanthine dehydrogenase accessory protein XdhC [Occultella glacieicola]|uniref:Xanthine dehydrogenase accessory protein XdhC n=1 Tax=Occultella glacieicola TaxID=2518684 RepID=A0ABY2E4S7_9MICO|nr:xanthine dehydrogenase accessory protein XdhC [Occultella glacieicola]TDE95025.1 xanthine dehydrogenase accessory protein XdhC [Occultella glacieicola]
MDWLGAVQRLRREGRPGVLVTVTSVRGHAPREAGAKMVVSADGSWGTIGGGNLEATAIEQARVLIAAGTLVPLTLAAALNEHETNRHGQQCCGGVVDVFLEPLPARPVVAVFGIGHVGLELGRILSRLPLVVHLADSRSAQLTAAAGLGLEDGPADVHLTHAPIPETLMAALPGGAHVLIMSHDHAEDMVLCDAALRRGDLGSIGLIGSSAKWARFRKRLREAGHTDAAIDTITCPIGLPGLHGKEPAVIAISTAAALLEALQREPGAGLHAADASAALTPGAPGK